MDAPTAVAISTDLFNDRRWPTSGLDTVPFFSPRPTDFADRPVDERRHQMRDNFGYSLDDAELRSGPWVTANTGGASDYITDDTEN